jgi:CHASE1-domain containing sensor protein
VEPLRRPPFLPSQPSRLAAATILTAGAGLAATVILALGVLHLEQDKLALAFEQRALMRVAAISRGLDQASEVVAVTNSLFNTVGPVSEAQFHAFTAPLVERNRFIKAFTFHRRIDDAERAAFEAELAQAHITSGGVRDIDNGRPVPAPRRPSYSPVAYIEPYVGNEAAYGVDASRSPQLEKALERAIASGRPSATGMLYLAGFERPQPGFLLVMPVYRAGADLSMPEVRRAAMTGDTVVSIRAADLVQIILDDQPRDDSLRMTIGAGGDDGRMQTVYPFTAQPGAARGPLPAFDHGAAGQGHEPALWRPLALPAHHVTDVDVGGQTWRIDIASSGRPLLADHLG